MQSPTPLLLLAALVGCGSSPITDRPTDPGTSLDDTGASPDDTGASLEETGSIDEEVDTAESTDTADAPPQSAATDTCVNAPTLAAASRSYQGNSALYTHTASGDYTGSNDYNPLETSGLAPACSLVFDASGADMVFAVTLEPGQTLHTELSYMPTNAIPAIYVVDDCPVTTWPDVNNSGLCGSNEYATDGYCGYTDCPALDWSFTWPVDIEGEPTARRTFYLVIDEINDSRATDYTLHWGISTPE